MDEVNQKNFNEWEKVGDKHLKFLTWKQYGESSASSRRRPTFLRRMSFFLEMAKWSEIFSISKGFRLCFLGISDFNWEEATWYKHVTAWVRLFPIVFVLFLYAVIMTPLGLLTGGYLWAREVKEYIFWGDMHKLKLSGDSKILKEKIDTIVKEQVKELKDQNKDMKGQINQLKEHINELKEQNKEQINELKEQNNELKEQINELKEQNKEQMKQILDAVAGKTFKVF